MEELRGAVTAGDVTPAHPGHVLRQLLDGAQATEAVTLPPEAELEKGKSYFLVPAAETTARCGGKGGGRTQGGTKGYDIAQAFNSVAYPHSNDQVEVINQKILRGLRARLDHAGGNSVNELPNILWAHCTTPREVTDITPFHLVYGGEAMVPVEVGVESDWVHLYDDGNAKRRLMKLNLVDEARDKVVVRLMAYRQRMKKNYNRRVIPRSFQVNDLV
ncbi:uncharacterized protein LOC122004664 [Zingiber officinale]|uniref:uncharacterized protein LOC122004664 n=1 Tax=Zingiber officinale TaxID=94328 RepID=UPI001C4B588F|nr:uncharacterized protein LOC122004664 [Zingiber officinale]